MAPQDTSLSVASPWDVARRNEYLGKEGRHKEERGRERMPRACPGEGHAGFCTTSASPHRRKPGASIYDPTPPCEILPRQGTRAEGVSAWLPRAAGTAIRAA